MFSPVTMRVRMREGMRVHCHHPRLLHARVNGSRHNMWQNRVAVLQCLYSYMFAEPFTHFPSSYVFYSLSLFQTKFIITLCSWYSPFFQGINFHWFSGSRIQYFNLLNPFHQVIAQIFIRWKRQYALPVLLGIPAPWSASLLLHFTIGIDGYPILLVHLSNGFPSAIRSIVIFSVWFEHIHRIDDTRQNQNWSWDYGNDRNRCLFSFSNSRWSSGEVIWFTQRSYDISRKSFTSFPVNTIV